MAFTPEEKRRRLIKSGFNPDEYDLIDSTDYYTKQEDDISEPNTTATEAMVTGARKSAGGLVGSLSAMAAVNLIPAALTGGGSLAVTLPLSLAAGMGGGYIGGKAQEYLEPKLRGEDESTTNARLQKEALLEAEHPYASMAGSIAPNLLAFRPDVNAVKNAFSGGKNLAIKALGGDAIKLAANEKNALLNVGINAGSGAGMSIGSDVVGGRDIDLGNAAKEALLNAALFHEPWLAGTKIFKFKPTSNTPETDDSNITLKTPNPKYSNTTPLEAVTQATRPEIPIQKYLDEVQFRDPEMQPAMDMVAIREQVRKEIAEEVLAANPELIVPSLQAKQVPDIKTPRINPQSVELLDNTKEMQKAALSNEVKPLTQNELLEREFENNLDKYQDEIGPKLTSVGEAAKPFSQTTEPEFITHTLTKPESKLHRREGLNPEINLNLKNPDKPDSIPSGVALLSEPETRRVQYNPDSPRFAADTKVHEPFHFKLQEMLDSKNPREVKLANKWIERFDGIEPLTEAVGKVGTKRIHESPEFFTFAKDLKAAAKHFVGRESREDVSRLAARKLITDPTFAERGGKLSATPNINANQSDDYSWQKPDGTFEAIKDSEYNHSDVIGKHLGVTKGDDVMKIAFEKGYNRVTNMGETLYVNSTKKPSQKQIKALTDLAIEKGKKKLVWDNDVEDTVIWTKDDVFQDNDDIIKSMRPAIQDIDGNIITGEAGSSHNETFFKQPKEWRLKNIDTFETGRGFSDSTKKFLSRKEAGKLVGLKPDEELHSEGLKALQENANVKPLSKDEQRIKQLEEIEDSPTRSLTTNQETELAQLRLDKNKNKYQDDDSPFITSTAKLLKNPTELKLTKDKNGEYDTSSLLGRIKNTVPPSEYNVLKDLGMEEYLSQYKKITDVELQKWLDNNAPKVEVHSYGQEGKVSKEKQEYDNLIHEIETAKPGHHVQFQGANLKYIIKDSMGNERYLQPDNIQAKLNRLTALHQRIDVEQMENKNSPRATSAYNTVSPKDTKTHPVVRVDVVIPKRELTYQEWLTRNGLNDTREWKKKYETREWENSGISNKEPTKWQQDNLHENLPNTLGWAAIQYETVGDKKIAHIFEAQSRWGQEVRERKALDKTQGQSEAGKQIMDKTDHPLLKDYNRLILKAAIEQARKDGATHIAISDAETAMMSEGHDLHNDYTPGEVATVPESTRVQQSAGMRLNYDKILPKIAEELTGSKGEAINFGEHKNAHVRDSEIGHDYSPLKPRENLIFKNQDGTPKTDVTARLYDISNVSARREKGEPFGLFSNKYQDSNIPSDHTEIKKYFSKDGFTIVPTIIKPELLKVSSMGNEGKVIATKALSFYEKFDKYRGELKDSFIHNFKNVAGMKWFNAKEQLLQENNNTKAFGQYFRDMYYRGESSIILTPKEQELADLWMEHSAGIAKKRNAADGMHHNKILNKYYFPLGISPKILQVVLDKPGSVEGMSLIKDWNEYYLNKNSKLAKPLDNAKVLAEAKKDLEIFRAGFTKRDINLAESFGPLDENKGYGLPESWVEQNPIMSMQRYLERASRRFAYNESIENSTEFKDAYAIVRGSGPVKNVMNEIFGYQPLQEPLVNAMMGVVRAGMLGTLTGTKDLISAHTLGMQHETPLQTVKSAIKAWSDIKQNIIESRLAGVNRDNITAFEMGDNENTAANILGKLRDTLSVVQGRAFLEKVSRGITYGKGKTIAMDNIWQHSKGTLSKQGEKFLNDFANEGWKDNTSGEFSPDDLSEISARFVRSIQGAYNFTGLPAISQQGMFAPYLSLSRWSIEKLNNYQKFVVTPAMNGNVTPLLMSTLGIVLGGSVITSLVEKVSNKKQKTPTNAEIIQAFKDKDGQGISALTYKLASLASMSGYAGFMGDLSKSAMDVAFKNKPQSLNNVLIDGGVNAYDISKDLIEAISSGDVNITSDAINRVLTDYLQLARIGYAQLDSDTSDKNAKSDKLRDLKVFKTTHGRNVSVDSDIRPNVFENSDEREFKQTDDLDAAKKLLPKIKTDIRTEAKGDKYQVKNKLTGLKTNSYQTIPNPRTNPTEFKRYIQHIKDTQGVEAAKALIADYNKRNRLNKMKSRLVGNR